MMHALATEHECAQAHKRVKQALHDAIVDHASPVLVAHYRAELAEIACAREALPRDGETLIEHADRTMPEAMAAARADTMAGHDGPLRRRPRRDLPEQRQP